MIQFLSDYHLTQFFVYHENFPAQLIRDEFQRNSIILVLRISSPLRPNRFVQTIFCRTKGGKIKNRRLF